MRTAALGRTGLDVPVVGFGCAPLGNLYEQVPEAQARAALEAAWDGGLRYYDTAPYYGLGLSERRVGAFLRDVPREEVVLQTKVGRLLRPRRGEPVHHPHGFAVPGDVEPVWDFSAEGVRRSLSESLERLGVDRVDVVLVHDPDEFEDEARRGALPELLRLREQGVVRAVGVGMNQAAVPTRFLAEFDLDVVLLAGRYNLVEQDALDDLLPAAQRAGAAVVLGGVFGSGLLAADAPAPGATYSYAPAPQDVLARAQRLAALAAAHGVPLPAVAVQAVLAHPAVAAVLLGMRSDQEVRADVALPDVPVPAAFWAALRGQDLVRADAPLPGEPLPGEPLPGEPLPGEPR
ncbi:aldo/keto reductase [Kineococcus arenarius]|uniref:aldo/keto reductase n=1 Tax=unclassified Kineococcus TaxID=2621656 RepID=UPI003D7DBC9E